jgi:hypothetical protein
MGLPTLALSCPKPPEASASPGITKVPCFGVEVHADASAAQTEMMQSKMARGIAGAKSLIRMRLRGAVTAKSDASQCEVGNIAPLLLTRVRIKSGRLGSR